MKTTGKTVWVSRDEAAALVYVRTARPTLGQDGRYILPTDGRTLCSVFAKSFAWTTGVKVMPGQCLRITLIAEVEGDDGNGN